PAPPPAGPRSGGRRGPPRPNTAGYHRRVSARRYIARAREQEFAQQDRAPDGQHDAEQQTLSTLGPQHAAELPFEPATLGLRKQNPCMRWSYRSASPRPRSRLLTSSHGS